MQLHDDRYRRESVYISKCFIYIRELIETTITEKKYVTALCRVFFRSDYNPNFPFTTTKEKLPFFPHCDSTNKVDAQFVRNIELRDSQHDMLSRLYKVSILLTNYGIYMYVVQTLEFIFL